MSVITRCPGCRTAFRVTPEQLALREGQVRCGQCRAVFDANDHRVAGEAPEEEGVPAEVATKAASSVVDNPAVPVADNPALPVADNPAVPVVDNPAVPVADNPAVPIADNPAVPVADNPAVPVTADPATPAGPAHATAEARAEAAPVPPSEAGTTSALERSRQYEWRPRKRLREQPGALYALAVVALLALLGAQALLEYRDALAAHAPFTRPLLDAACRVAGCAIAPLRDASALFIEASDLEADPAHKGLLELRATVRNRASYAIAYPHLELTLTDASDNVVARRAFPPAIYASPGASGGGIAPNGEVLVRLFLDASATSQAGYRVYLFYP